MLFVLGAAFIGCAPSLRIVHQSNTFFERCHSADYNPRVTNADRRQCWTRWLEHYTTGQSPDRLAFARDRLNAIESGEPVRPMPGMPGAAVQGSYTASYFALAPEQDGSPASDLEARPMSGTAESRSMSASAARDNLPSPPSADHQCSSVCAPRWYSCIEQCDDPHGACRHACESEHNTCLSGCF